MTTTPARRRLALLPAAVPAPRFAGLLRGGLAFAVLLGAAAAVAALVGTTVTAEPAVLGIDQPDLLVRWGIPVVRTILDTAAVATAGLALLSRFVGFDAPEETEPVVAPARRAAVVTSAIWFFAALLSVVALTAELSTPTPAGIWRYVVGIAAGKGLLFSAGCAAFSWWLCRLSLRHGEAVPAELRAGVALFGLLPLPLTGHAANWTYHDLGMVAMELHVVGASAWAGGLGAVVIFLARRPELLAVALPRFSRLATWCVFLVGVTGVFNGLLELALSPITRLPGSLVTTRYGVLLLAKLVCFGVVGLIALHVRTRLLSRVIQGRPATVALWCGCELLVLAVAFGVAVALTRTAVTPF